MNNEEKVKILKQFLDTIQENGRYDEVVNTNYIQNFLKAIKQNLDLIKEIDGRIMTLGLSNKMLGMTFVNDLFNSVKNYQGEIHRSIHENQYFYESNELNNLKESSFFCFFPNGLEINSLYEYHKDDYLYKTQIKRNFQKLDSDEFKVALIEQRENGDYEEARYDINKNLKSYYNVYSKNDIKYEIYLSIFPSGIYYCIASSNKKKEEYERYILPLSDDYDKFIKIFYYDSDSFSIIFSKITSYLKKYGLKVAASQEVYVDEKEFNNIFKKAKKSLVKKGLTIKQSTSYN